MAHFALSWNRLSGPELRPFAHFFAEAIAANDIVLKAKLVVRRHLIAVYRQLWQGDVSVDRRVVRLEDGHFCQMRLLVVRFDSMVGNATIDIAAIHANTHRAKPQCETRGLSSL